MPRPDSLPHTTHYQMSDYRHQHSTERRDPDLLALQVWADAWDDAATPRTADPIRFQFRRISVWCDPRPTFDAATWTEELRALGYYRQRGN